LELAQWDSSGVVDFRAGQKDFHVPSGPVGLNIVELIKQVKFNHRGTRFLLRNDSGSECSETVQIIQIFDIQIIEVSEIGRYNNRI